MDKFDMIPYIAFGICFILLAFALTMVLKMEVYCVNRNMTFNDSLWSNGQVTIVCGNERIVYSMPILNFIIS